MYFNTNHPDGACAQVFIERVCVALVIETPRLS